MIDFNRVDAALFAIEKYLNAVVGQSGRYEDHADYFLEVLRNLRHTIANESQADLGTTIIQEPPPARPDGRAGDKGIMSDANRHRISRAMKLSWKKRRKEGRKR